MPEGGMAELPVFQAGDMLITRHASQTQAWQVDQNGEFVPVRTTEAQQIREVQPDEIPDGAFQRLVERPGARYTPSRAQCRHFAALGSQCPARVRWTVDGTHLCNVHAFDALANLREGDSL